MIAQNESAKFESERIQKEQAIKEQAIKEKNRAKIYDDIVFDSRGMTEIHPKLHATKVHHMRD